MAGQSYSSAKPGAAILKQKHLISVDLGQNNNKFWDIALYDDNLVETHYGRVGDGGLYSPKPFSSSWQAESFFDSKLREKLKGSSNSGSVYKEREAVAVGASQTTVTSVATSNLAALAAKQIVTNSPQTIQLVQYLAKVNQHSIVSQTTLTFSESDNLFKTALNEVVTPAGVAAARLLLDQIADFVAQNDYDNPALVRVASDYLQYVPTDIGRGRLKPVDLYPDLSAVQKQNTILDALEGSFAAMQAIKPDGTPAPKTDEEQLFKVRLHIVENGNVIDRLRRLYKSTLNYSHEAARLDVKCVYEVEIDCMAAAFESAGAKLGNIEDLWHGSKAGNLLSILKSGYIIPPSNSSHCTGRMFGNGVYFSDQSTKSLNYAGGWAPGQTSWGYDGNAFMFLNKVAMGKSYTPRSYTEHLPKPGYDSTFAKAGVSGIRNNEMIVYRTNQINPCYLIQFSNGGS